MSWFDSLVKAYESNQKLAGVDKNGLVLVPVGHVTQNAQIEILLNKNGELLSINVVDKSDASTLMPATIESASRSSGLAPHPLHDKLKYVAGDYVKFVDNSDGKGFEMYLTALKKWANSNWPHPALDAILAYVEKKSLIDDLVKNKIIYLGENGKIREKWTKELGDKPKLYQVLASGASDSLVRFKVDFGDEKDQRTWLDTELQNSFVQYYGNLLNSEAQKNISFYSGDEVALISSHSRGLRYPSDSAKLISSNQTSGFAFRGLFHDADEAVGIGYYESQKAHNALRWLIQKQGANINGKTFVAWSNAGSDLPSFLSGSEDLFGSDTEQLVFTDEDFSRRLLEAVKGKKFDLEHGRDAVSIMVLNAATQGRLAIEFYTEMLTDDYIDRIAKWHERSAWEQFYMRDKQAHRYYGVVSPYYIAKLCYGENVKDKIVARTIERIVYSIINGQTIPADLLKKVVDRAGRPIVMSNVEWEQTLRLACSLYKNYHYERRKYGMQLDKSNHRRSYLFGRLLAVLDKIEDYCNFINQIKDRPTNAKRYMTRFAQRPISTWEYLYKKTLSYQMRLKKAGKLHYFESIIEQILSEIDANNYKNDKALDGEYLLGFYHQRAEFNHKMQKQENEEGEEND